MYKPAIRTPILILAPLFIAGCALFPGEEPAPPAAPASPPATVAAPPATPVEATPAEAPRKNRRIVHAGAAPASPPLTVWDDFREYGQFDLTLDNPRIREHRSGYTRNPRYLSRVLTQAHPYWHFIQSEAIRRGLPTELVLIPVLESGFNPAARGPGGPAGLWQFMPGTARVMGLRVSGSYDGRLDVIASTEAAFNYLEKLAQHFDGDWLLALAAYNAGEGTIKNAIALNRRRGLPADFWSLPLRSVTRHYVPRILALNQVLNDPGHYGLNLPPIPNQPFLTTVDVPARIALADAARLAGMSLADLRRLNPALRGAVVDPAGPQRLLIPLTQADSFRTALARTPLKPAPVVASATPPQWHRVVAGESLWTIARKYRVSVNTLARWNGLNVSAPLAVGRKLAVQQP